MEPMGGSETAVIRLSAALRRLGHQIEIITTPEELKGRSCDVLVACRDWRAILLDSISAKLRYLWCQDDINENIVKNLWEKNGQTKFMRVAKESRSFPIIK